MLIAASAVRSSRRRWSPSAVATTHGSATATVALGGSLSGLRHLDVGDQYTYAAGGESSHGGEERACFRCGHRRTDGIVIRVVQVDQAVSRRRTPIFFRPDLRRLEPQISRYSPSGLQLLRLIGGFEGGRVGRVVIDDRDLGLGQWISLASLIKSSLRWAPRRSRR